MRKIKGHKKLYYTPNMSRFYVKSLEKKGDNKMKELRIKVEELNKKYEEVKDEINGIKADGSLSKLCNLMQEFDETFDQFFDDEELRKKYNAWDYEEDCPDYNKDNADLLEELDKEDLEAYIDFYTNYIEQLEEQLYNLQTGDGFKYL